MTATSSGPGLAVQLGPKSPTSSTKHGCGHPRSANDGFLKIQLRGHVTIARRCSACAHWYWWRAHTNGRGGNWLAVSPRRAPSLEAAWEARRTSAATPAHSMAMNTSDEPGVAPPKDHHQTATIANDDREVPL